MSGPPDWPAAEPGIRRAMSLIITTENDDVEPAPIETDDVTVVVATRNRPHLLAETTAVPV
jgi:hypothetical protein